MLENIMQLAPPYIGAIAPPAMQVPNRYNLLLPLEGPTLSAVQAVVQRSRGKADEVKQVEHIRLTPRC